MTKKMIAVGLLSALFHGNASADIKAGEGKSMLCDLCHNAGSHDGGMAPLLEAQPAPYLALQLQAFKDKRRTGGGMDTNTLAMSAEDMRDIAEYFSAQKQPRTSFRADPARAALGRQKAEELKCASCHLADYSGRDDVPRLAGQWWDYLTAQLENFRSGRRSHGGASPTDTVRNPTAEDSEILVHFLAPMQ